MNPIRFLLSFLHPRDTGTPPPVPPLPWKRTRDPEAREDVWTADPGNGEVTYLCYDDGGGGVFMAITIDDGFPVFMRCNFKDVLGAKSYADDYHRSKVLGTMTP